ncbi:MULTISPECIES: LPS assembly protein LptD [Rahnella]|uniref:LPS assembly protein LptD n=1 Tax=Rahnella TaxID=34037 RepID=UPI0010A31BD9|nr:LPS assembly protein LptD [Rahnella rivi]MBU9830020.1 LPS assembly protein LptD [Rahnella rivi]THD43029.1 LPS assembly protein LptD [Enterobacteriaceae bacterium ML5]
MKNRRLNTRLPTMLAATIWSALYSHGAMADLAAQCMLGVPTYDKPLVQGDPNSLPVTINADKATGNYPDSALFSGNVNVVQGNSTLDADQVQLNQIANPNQPTPTRTATATGNVRYNDNQIKLNGPKGFANLTTKDTDVENGDYQMVGRQGRGDADKMKQRDNNRYTIMDNGTFTTCLPGDNSWSVVGSEVIQDRQEEVAEIWNARFHIGPVPVFYSPYMQLPIGDRRRSGFLIPNAKYSSNNGFGVTVPYYWNIAPNYDATITPNYMSTRGLQLQNEFRYLTVAGAGLMEFDFLGNDKKIDDQYVADENRISDKTKRWMYYWVHSGVYDQVWRFNVDYTKVSDPYYFTDFDSKYGSSTDGYATQKFSVGYFNENWNATLASKQFQVFSDYGNTNAYRAQPQLDVNYYQNDVGPFDLHIYGQAAKFTSVNPDNPEAIRTHIEPTISLPLSNGWGSLDNEVKLMATHYQQDISDNYYEANPNTKLRSSVNRVMPEFKSDGKMVFDRTMDWNSDYTQTLEPRVQYLYIPYRNQSSINTYDSTLLQSDYTGLFRDKSYSGLDRIASANQVASGLTTRIYDDGLVERFNASAGQIYYFQPPRTGDQNSALDKNDDTGSLVWAGDTYYKINNFWGIRGGVQYDTRLDSLAVGDAVLEYKADSERMIQLSYRYASPEYIQATLPSVTNPGYQDGISQVGGIASWPIADRWAIVGAYYYDTKAQQPADQLIGLQYNTCCWAINVGYERKITNYDSVKSESKYDNKIGFNIELRGLGSNQTLGTKEMLASGILPYQRAF